jgi:glutaminase
MINAGAIVVASLIPGATAEEKSARIVDGLSAFAGRRLDVDDAVYQSELATGDRNRELATLTFDAGLLGASVDVATEAYFRQCSVTVTAFDIAVMAATLAGSGRHPLTGERIVSEPVARWTLSVMASCGMYDGSGEWLARVGLPAKSGVAGGIVAADPGHFGIGTWAPRLDERGNSVRGIAMLEALSSEYGLHVFGHQGEYLSPVGSAETVDGELRIVLRGELGFAGVEDLVAVLDGATGPIVIDLTAVTLVRSGAARLIRAATLGLADRIRVIDPSGWVG